MAAREESLREEEVGGELGRTRPGDSGEVVYSSVRLPIGRQTLAESMIGRKRVDPMVVVVVVVVVLLLLLSRSLVGVVWWIVGSQPWCGRQSCDKPEARSLATRSQADLEAD